MKRRGNGTVGTIVIVALTSAAILPGSGLARSLSADQIVDSLAPRAKAKSRSIVIGKSASDRTHLGRADRDFLHALPSRGLKVEARNKLEKIVAETRLPKIDMEINFSFNSARIDPDSIPDLMALGKALNNPALADARIALNGHTDAIGDDAYNLALSEDRAVAVRDYLVDHFPIDPRRLIAIGYGEERLKNASQPDAPENRRVEVINLGGY